MSSVIDLASWQRGRPGGPEEDPRLEAAITRVDRALADQTWRRPPPWLVTELLAVQGCVSMGLSGEAGSRLERVADRLEQMASRSRSRAR